MKSTGRILLAPAYLLHQTPWRDSSRVLEFFTRDHGRLSVFARGVRRPGSQVGSVLQPFQPLLVSFSLRGEAGSFIAAELDGPPATPLAADRTMSAFYLNELLLRLLGRHDSHPRLYADYAGALAALRGPCPQVRALRLFEKRLLESLGYGLELGREAGSGAALEPDAHYHYLPERGAVRAGTPTATTYSGAMLLALATEKLQEDTLQDETALRAARRLLQGALNACLEGRALNSREVMRAMRRMNEGMLS
jgi:DNA repair protein RecO (recombination protein O)